MDAASRSHLRPDLFAVAIERHDRAVGVGAANEERTKAREETER